MKSEIKKIIKKLPTEISVIGLALLLSIIEGGKLALTATFEGNKGRSGLIHSLRGIGSEKSFLDFYDEIKKFEIKSNSARTILWRLQQKGLIKKKEKDFYATDLGKKIGRLFQKNILETPKWDDKWRMIFFDIPETHRKKRQWLYSKLVNSNYKPIQKSVFLGKFPLDQNLMKEIIEKDLYKNVRIITVGEIDDEGILI